MTPKINPTTFEWLALKKIIEDRIEALRDDLENTNASPTETATIRGGISELRDLLQKATT